MKKACFIETPIGRVGIAEEYGMITNVGFSNTVKPAVYEECETPLLIEAARQLGEYFNKRRLEFELPLAPQGSEFAQAVYLALRRIPYGQTHSYGDIARELKKERAYRAVGRANACNPISLFIPCHRVIGANNRLTGYAGGIAAKEFLLRLEGALT